MWLALLICLALLPAWGAAAQASRRVAIVVGVTDYGGAGDLANPARDARQMGSTLSRLGYEVSLLTDPKPEALDGVIAAARGSGAPIAQLAFFFSGHGATRGGRPLLVLNDGARGQRRLAEIPLSALIEKLAALKPTSTLFMLDACRSDVGAVAAGTQPGLASPPRVAGAFFAYAAAPGDVALDAGATAPGLSPFAFALADELLVPNQDIGVVMRKVRERVAVVTGGRQLPWTEDSLTGPLVLNEAPTSPELFDVYGRMLKGDVASQRDLGLAYLGGRGVTKDVERGAALLRDAGAKRDVPALLALGDLEASREVAALRPQGKARAWYGQAATLGSAEARYRLAELDRKTLIGDAKPSDATIDLYRKAAADGQRDARARYLQLNLRHGFDKTLDRDATVAALRENAGAGNTLSAAILGSVYSTLGTPQTDFKEADFWLAKAAREGSTEALLQQSKIYGLGIGRPVDQPRSYRLNLEAAERGNGQAMLFTGRMLQQGTGTAPDDAAACRWFRGATEAGEREAFADLGYCYEAGRGVDRDIAQAVALYRRGADLSDPVSLRSLATLYEFGTGVRRNMDRAVALYTRAGDLGDMKARSAIAVLANNGMLTSHPDPKLGAALLAEVSRRGGDAETVLKLAQMTEKGVGRPADPAEAARLYQKAADLGSPFAATELGALYKEGIGVPKDVDKALALWAKAAEAGDGVAYTNLAITYRQRNRTPEDQEEAGRWARRGAEAGESESMVAHGRNLFLGREGMARDTRAGFAWLTKGLEAGNGWAAGTLVAIANDPAIDAAQADRDEALLLLVRAAGETGNPLAAEALRMIYKAREGVDIRGATRAALEARLDGPQRGMTALLLGIGFEEGRFDGRPDPVAAARYLTIAAESGEAEAWRHLGDLELNRLVPTATPARALAAYRRGADLGEPGALTNLGVMYLKGVGVSADPARSFAAFRQAAERGFAPAMYNLGVAYQRGYGTEVSRDLAEEWYGKASAAGNQDAQVGLVTVLLNADPEDRDYTRALYHLNRLAVARRPEASTALDEICRDRDLPRPVRARAVAILAEVEPTMPDAGNVLRDLRTAGVVKRGNSGYVLAQ